LSRSAVYALLAAVLFSILAWLMRASETKAEPIMLAIAAVTLSTMHQSSLGSLFLLMPDEVAPQWWSPVMPISFFLSSIAAGTSLVILVEMWIAKAWDRHLRTNQLGQMARISFWALLIYLVFRLGDLGIRGGLFTGWTVRTGILFALEIVGGGFLALFFLDRAARSADTRKLFFGALLTTLGVVLNRANVVLLAMRLRGPMPQVAPSSYSPSIFEWGISIGLIAATVFLFGLGVRTMPVLPRSVQQGD